MQFHNLKEFSVYVRRRKGSSDPLNKTDFMWVKSPTRSYYYLEDLV